MSSRYESSVDPLRPNDAHGISLQLVGRNKKVLELGAASGHVTRALKELGNQVTAVERDGRFGSSLQELADAVIITDLDWLDLREKCEGTTFDVILAGDVLEHCTRPDLVLLQCHFLLNKDGYMVISLPNIAHADVRLALLTGNFVYRDVGLLDRTHLRFFTRETIETFLEENGFEIAETFASTAPVGTTEIGPPAPSIPRAAIDFVQSDRDSLVYQYVMRARPVHPVPIIEMPPPHQRDSDKLLAEVSLSNELLSIMRSSGGSIVTRKRAVELEEKLASLESEVQKLRVVESTQQELVQSKDRQLHDLNSQIHDLNSQIHDLQGELHDLRYSVMQARDQIIGTTAEMGVLRARNSRLQADVDSMVHQLNLIHSSRTWRIGRFILRPIHWIRRLARVVLGG